MSNRVAVSFQMYAEEREYLRILALRAKMPVSEFLRQLILDYGRTLVRVRECREAFVPEGGLPGEKTPIVYVSIDESGQPTLVSRRGNSLASIMQLQYFHEWIMGNIPLSWMVQLQEGIFRRNSETAATLALVEDVEK